MPKLIGVNGKARSGKNTTADYIQSWCWDKDLTSAQRGFADRLKRSAAHALGIFKDEIEFCNKLKGDYEQGSIEVRMTTKGGGPNQQMVKITGREYLQYYGTEAHRDVFGDNFWVDALLPLADHMDGTCEWWWNFQTEGETADVAIITDVRFDNEAERIQELGGDVWKVEREGSGAGNHASEQDLPMELVDVVIDNNGTLDDLSDSVEVLMEMISTPEEVGINVAV